MPPRGRPRGAQTVNRGRGSSSRGTTPSNHSSRGRSTNATPTPTPVRGRRLTLLVRTTPSRETTPTHIESLPATPSRPVIASTPLYPTPNFDPNATDTPGVIRAPIPLMDVLAAVDAWRNGGHSELESLSIAPSPTTVSQHISGAWRARRPAPTLAKTVELEIGLPSGHIRARPSFGLLYSTTLEITEALGTIRRNVGVQGTPGGRGEEFWIPFEDGPDEQAAIIYLNAESVCIRTSLHDLTSWTTIDPPIRKGFIHRIPTIGWQMILNEAEGLAPEHPTNAYKLGVRYRYLWEIVSHMIELYRDEVSNGNNPELSIDVAAYGDIKLAREAEAKCREEAKEHSDVNHIVIPASATKESWKKVYDRYCEEDARIHALVTARFEATDQALGAQLSTRKDIMSVARRIMVAVSGPIRGEEVFEFLQSSRADARCLPPMGKIFRDKFEYFQEIFPGKFLLDDGEAPVDWSCSRYATITAGIHNSPVEAGPAPSPSATGSTGSRRSVIVGWPGPSFSATAQTPPALTPDDSNLGSTSRAESAYKFWRGLKTSESQKLATAEGLSTPAQVGRASASEKENVPPAEEEHGGKAGGPSESANPLHGTPLQTSTTRNRTSALIEQLNYTPQSPAKRKAASPPPSTIAQIANLVRERANIQSPGLARPMVLLSGEQGEETRSPKVARRSAAALGESSGSALGAPFTPSDAFSASGYTAMEVAEDGEREGEERAKE